MQDTTMSFFYLKNTKRFGYIVYYEYFCKLKCI